jgi:hypothetical protein
MASIHAAGSDRDVTLFERTADGGRKILISGGGRCNVLPGTLDETRFTTASSGPSLRMIVRSWPLHEQRAYFESELGLPLVLEPDTGKLFPMANRARAVRDALVAAARVRGVQWRPNTEIVAITPHQERWMLTIAGGATSIHDAVILTTGGLSVPQTGSDGFGLRALAALGHVVHPTYPALTPITATPPPFADLAGVSLTVAITARSEAERADATGGFLFTHRGYSGPALLDVSHVAVRSRQTEHDPAQLRVSWGALRAADWERRLVPSGKTVASVVREELPARLADRLIALTGVDGSTALAHLTRGNRLALIETLGRFVLPWDGDEGYRKAEVTGGGVALDQVDPRTLQSRLYPGLYLAGELLDAFGPIGGYNFVWAWVTGRLAGRAAAAALTSSS